jgi:bacterioferritin
MVWANRVTVIYREVVLSTNTIFSSTFTNTRNMRSRFMDKQKLIDNLNQDLSNELAAIIQYITYSAQVTGPFRPQLVSFFLKEVPDEQGHAEFLANKVVALGGVPTTMPAPVAPAETNKELLEAALVAERKAVAGYIQRAKEAEEIGDVGLQVQLEDMVRDETGHAEEIERMLRDWSMATA